MTFESLEDNLAITRYLLSDSTEILQLEPVEQS